LQTLSFQGQPSLRSHCKSSSLPAKAAKLAVLSSHATLSLLSSVRAAREPWKAATLANSDPTAFPSLSSIDWSAQRYHSGL